MHYATRMYPGAEDISTTDSSVQTKEVILTSIVVNLNTEGDLRETRQCDGGEGGNAHMCCATEMYPGAEDISTTDSSVQTKEGALTSIVVNLNTEGDLKETRQCIGEGRGVMTTCTMPSKCTQELRTSTPPPIHQCRLEKGLYSPWLLTLIQRVV